jgi:ketosteroid isomerase-like protein
VEIADEIERLEAQFVDLFNGHDAPRLVDMYTRHAQVFPPNTPVVRGRGPLESLFRSFWSEGFTVMSLETIEVEGSDDIVYEVGAYKISGQRKQDPSDEGKYIVIWKKEDDVWKLHRDIFNTDLPEQKCPDKSEQGQPGRT